MKAVVRSGGRGENVELHIAGITQAPDHEVRAPVLDEPTPDELLAASLASCTATAMELYARRKGWGVDTIEVDVDYAPSQRGSLTRCTVVVRLPESLPAEQCDRLMQVGATSGIHRTLEGEVVFDERLELIDATSSDPTEAGPREGRAAGAFRSSTGYAGR
ncbi:MAG: OsmC family protein [Thermoleophilaceae bacterium]